MPFDVAQLTAEISVDTRQAEWDLQRFGQRLNQLGRQDATEAERGIGRVWRGYFIRREGELAAKIAQRF